MRTSKWIERAKRFVADDKLGDLILAEDRTRVRKAIGEIEETGKGTPDQWVSIRYGTGRYERLLEIPDTTIVPHMGVFRDYMSTMIKTAELFQLCQQRVIEEYGDRTLTLFNDPNIDTIVDDARTIKTHLDSGGYHAPAFDRVASALNSRLEKMMEVSNQQTRERLDSWGSGGYTPLSNMVHNYGGF
ncbi:MAG: hypothetical protein AABX51_01910 [Nanoarchaeota archaeon]